MVGRISSERIDNPHTPRLRPILQNFGIQPLAASLDGRGEDQGVIEGVSAFSLDLHAALIKRQIRVDLAECIQHQVQIRLCIVHRHRNSKLLHSNNYKFLQHLRADDAQAGFQRLLDQLQRALFYG